MEVNPRPAPPTPARLDGQVQPPLGVPQLGRVRERHLVTGADSQADQGFSRVTGTDGGQLGRRVKLALLVGDLRQAHIPGASHGQVRAAGPGRDVDRLLVGAERRVQAAPGTLDLAEVVAAADRQGAFAGHPPLRGNRRQHLLGFGEPGAHPLGEAEVAAGVGRQHPLVVTDHGQGLRRERGRLLGVAAERGEVRTLGRDRRGHVHQPAPPAGRRHGRLTLHASSARLRALGGIQQLPGRLHPAAGQGHARPGQQQPRPRTGYFGRDRREPPLHRRPLAPPEEERVEMPFDQPGGPDGIHGRQRVPYRLIGQPVFLVPGRRVAM